MMLALTAQAQQKIYTLADWNLKDWDATKGELALNVSEYKLDFNHPLPYTDMQDWWRVKAELKCGTLGTEQVFVCKEGKASHLIGKNSLNSDISLGYDNTEHRFFVEVTDCNEKAHRLWAGAEVQADRWYAVDAVSKYDSKRDQSTVTLTVDGTSSSLTYPGKALRHNCSLWVIRPRLPGRIPQCTASARGSHPQPRD